MSMKEPRVLVAWRASAGMTQAQAAASVGVKQPTWCDWEGGNRAPSFAHALRIEEMSDGAVPVETFGHRLEDVKIAARVIARRQASLALPAPATITAAPDAA